MICAVACDVFDGANCQFTDSGGAHDGVCYFNEDTQFTALCAPPGNVAGNEACEEWHDCVPGFQCLPVTEGKSCLSLCDAEHPCETGICVFSGSRRVCLDLDHEKWGAFECGPAQTCTTGLLCADVVPSEEAIAVAPKGEPVGQPDTACYLDPAEPGAGPEVKVTGCLGVFGLASNTVDLEVTYFLDGYLDDPIAGPAVAVDNIDCESGGYYEMTGVPTNTRLVRKTSCPPSLPDCGFKDTWQFHVYLDASTAASGTISGKDNAEANTFVTSEATWLLIPRTLGFSSGIDKDHGMVAGRIKDCDSNHIMGAVVGISVPVKRIAYFDGAEGTLDDMGNEKASDPDSARDATNSDGLYAAVDVGPGPASVNSQILVEKSVVSLGVHKIDVMPNSMIILDFKGKTSGLNP
ncbi:MAG: hypothetical protein HY897_25855 [Deltaproteobacteria bacterium]|nr:hypothetical protein [Deltaproteobacteria bacterium]